mmetsp:Transcript_29382/g.57659  ORF Transcript_29382/g.57659 Transcript_29382/m.57659 type:complete len:251 (-) Transcript_29382:89-841(-)
MLDCLDQTGVHAVDVNPMLNEELQQLQIVAGDRDVHRVPVLVPGVRVKARAQNSGDAGIVLCFGCREVEWSHIRTTLFHVHEEQIFHSGFFYYSLDNVAAGFATHIKGKLGQVRGLQPARGDSEDCLFIVVHILAHLGVAVVPQLLQNIFISRDQAFAKMSHHLVVPLLKVVYTVELSLYVLILFGAQLFGLFLFRSHFSGDFFCFFLVSQPCLISFSVKIVHFVFVERTVPAFNDRLLWDLITCIHFGL